GVSTKHDFDGAGRLTTVTKPFKIYNPVTLNDYANPQVLDANPADQTITRYEYNLAGNLIKQTDANQTVVVPPTSQKYTSFTYDELGRRLTRILPEGQSESWSYDSDVA